MTELEGIIEKLKTNPTTKIHDDYGLNYKQFNEYIKMMGISPTELRIKERRRVVLEMPHLLETEMCELLNCSKGAITKTKRQLRDEGYHVATFSNRGLKYPVKDKLTC